MYTRRQALAFVEDSEYIRERARIAARDLLDRFDVQECLEDPEKAAADIVDELIAVLMLDLIRFSVNRTKDHAVELGLPLISEEDAAMVVSDAIDEIHANAESDIAARIQDADNSVRADGTSDDVIVKSISTPAGRAAFFAGVVAILTSAAAGLIALIEQGIMDAAHALFIARGGDSALRWHATGDGRSCDDVVENSCAPRDGLEKTYDQWVHLGLPGAGNLLCSMFSRSGLPQCRCEMGSPKLEREEPGVLDITEAVKAGRERANG